MKKYSKGYERVAKGYVPTSVSHERGEVGGRREVLVRPSRRRISLSSFSIPDCASAPTDPRQPCLSKKYVSRFILSSGRPSSRANSRLSSRSTSCAAMMDAAAASRTFKEVSEVWSVSAYEDRSASRHRDFHHHVQR